MRLLIRADAAPRMGAGHVMRCLALALAAQELGHEVLLAGRLEVGWLAGRLKREKVPFQPLPGPIPPLEDAAGLAALVKAQNPDAMVLDGYHFGLDGQRAVMEAGVTLMVIDDYNHLPEYQADILLNQNIGADALDYRGRIGRKLTGPGYALLRPEFAAARAAAEKRVLPERPERLLLTLGGGDFSDRLQGLAPAFSRPELAGLTLTVLAGQMPPDKIRAALADCPARLEILTAVEDLAGLLLETDLAVSAGGSTCWELCCLGVPFLTVEIAENQRDLISCLEKAAIARIFSPDAWPLYLQNQTERKALLTLVDGIGAKKACQILLNH